MESTAQVLSSTPNVFFPDTGKYFQYALKKITEEIGRVLITTSGNDYYSCYKVRNFYNTYVIRYN